jgi:hypothetical protein
VGLNETQPAPSTPHRLTHARVKTLSGVGLFSCYLHGSYYGPLLSISWHRPAHHARRTSGFSSADVQRTGHDFTSSVQLTHRHCIDLVT